MSEHEIREGLRVAVWDEPPLDFDPDALIAKAEKVRNRRRALVSVGVGTALVVVSAFALPTLFSAPRPDSTNVAQSPTASSARPSETDDSRAQRLSERLMKTMPMVLPRARDLAPDTFDDSRKTDVPLGRPGGRFRMFMMFDDDIGPTAIKLEIGDRMSAEQYCSGMTTCRQEGLSDGTVVVVVEELTGTDLTMASVTHLRGNSTAVTFTAYAYNPTNGSGHRKTVPIGPEGLRLLATDPHLSWD